MRDFVYNGRQGLRAADCEWLRKIGLEETLWILDREWIFYSYNNMTFNKWTAK